MAAMASLVAAVAHEVRNPLFALSATADLLAARFSGVKDLDRHLVALRGQVERLDELIRTLLEYGQAFVPDLREGRLAPVIERAVEACRALASEREVDLRLRLSATLPLVRLEQGRLVQVFENVVRNALQHSPKGGTVSIEAAETEDEAGRWISCAVRDSGDGFDEQEIPKVFEPFYTQTRGATGMGLTIAWRIVQDHRGTIAVANAPAGGAVVTVRLPAGLPGTTGSGR
jgi:signal transduction histidine kinase